MPLLDKLNVTSEVERLQAIILEPPGAAHLNLLPEHVEPHLAVKELLQRRLRLGPEDLSQVQLAEVGGTQITIERGTELELRYTTADGSTGSFPLGRGLSNLFLENPQYLLFDDIVDHAGIRSEYARFDQVVRTIAPHTLYLSDLVLEALHQLHLDRDAADGFFDRLERLSPEPERQNARYARVYFEEHGSRLFLDLLMTGRDHFGRYVFPPLPNLLFTRDIAAVVGDAVILCSAMKTTRRREFLLGWLVFNCHPMFVSMREAGKFRMVDVLSLGVDDSAGTIAIEGGDIIHLGNRSLIIGAGERTTVEGAIEAARLLWSLPDPPVDRIIVVKLVHTRSAMHLDTIFTFADQNGPDFEAMVFGPFIEEGAYGQLTYYSLSPDDFDDDQCRTVDDLEAKRTSSISQLLKDELGMTMSPIFCGGPTPPLSPEPSQWVDPEAVFVGQAPNALSSKREQWTDGANLFALAPGVVVTYQRNRRSLDELAAHGFEIVDVDRFCANSRLYLRQGLDHKHRVAIPLGGSELSRGRGGARCMTMPLLRG